MNAQMELPVGLYSGQSALHAQIRALWIAKMPPEQRTREGFRAFVKSQLLAAGKDVFPAVETKAGDCIFCGESGRCPGWHYYGEN